jgi:hypothetical protein
VEEGDLAGAQKDDGAADAAENRGGGYYGEQIAA